MHGRCRCRRCREPGRPSRPGLRRGLESRCHGRRPGGFAFIAHAGGRAAGFVLGRTTGDECEILTLAVLRRRGLGRALVERLLARAATDGATTVFLEVAEDNKSAGCLYAGAGFTTVGRRPGYYRRRGRPAVAARVLRLDLAQP
ncbi:MAG: GNAT family N-acetyltransferase [Alphaproteobacteria bacterium]